MIDTTSRSKLPRFLAYPANAKMICEGLPEIETLENVRLWFVCRGKPNDNRTVIHSVIDVCYSPFRKLSIASAMDGRPSESPAWDVWVRSVPRDVNALVRTAICDYGFAMIRDWLVTPRSDVWLSSSHRCTISYDRETNSVSINCHDR